MCIAVHLNLGSVCGLTRAWSPSAVVLVAFGFASDTVNSVSETRLKSVNIGDTYYGMSSRNCCPTHRQVTSKKPLCFMYTQWYSLVHSKFLDIITCGTESGHSTHVYLVSDKITVYRTLTLSCHCQKHVTKVKGKPYSLFRQVTDRRYDGAF